MSDKPTIRDTFAAAALTGLLAGRSHEERNVTVDLWAGWAVQLADAMLAARGDNPPSPAADATSAAGEDAPGDGYRWVKPGEAFQAGDEIKQVRMSGTRWLACARVGRVVSEAESFIWRRRRTTDLEAAPAATASGREQTVAESVVNLGITADSIAESVAVFVARLVHAGLSRHEIKASVRQQMRREIGWLDRLVKEAAAAQPAHGVTLTDAEREVLRECADIAWEQLLYAEEGGEEETIARWTRRNAALRGLLARTAREGGR
jgi:hypothetical protein